MAGQLTTHVLDITQGHPAANMQFALWRIGAPITTATADLLAGYHGTQSLLLTGHTNAQGRTDEPLLVGADMRAGIYELVFAVGAYFAQQSQQGEQHIFLDIVPLRFTITAPEEHYHVPLLASPWAYSTYRGS